MTKAEFIAKLEVVKDHSPVVSIDFVLAGLNMLQPDVKVETVVGLNKESFDEIMDAVGSACRNIRSSRAVDFDSAQFCINYNNQVELEDVELDTDFIEDVIREELESLVDWSEPEEGTLTDIPDDGFIEAQREAADTTYRLAPDGITRE